MHMKLTDRSIQKLSPQAKRYVAWKEGGQGMGVRVSPKGKKTFIFMYRYDGQPRMMTLGDYPRVSLADANLRHSEAAKVLEKGEDPGKARVEENKRNRAAETVKELAERYVEEWAKRRKRTWRKDDLILKKDILPEWKNRKAKDITRKDVKEILAKILKRKAPIQANRTLACVRKMFAFALDEDIVDNNPCAGVRMPSPENRGHRVLIEAEIKNLWQNLAKTTMHPNTRNAIKLALLTGQRIGEVVSCEWQEIDLETGWWVIPGKKAKNGLQHRVPLSAPALAIIEEVKSFADETYLFPSPREGHIHVTAISHALKRAKEKLEIEEKFTAKDLRRTAASHITGMGISRLTVSKILNHVESHVTAVYDRYSYDKDKQAALAAWGVKVLEIAEGKASTPKVVQFRGKK